MPVSGPGIAIAVTSQKGFSPNVAKEEPPLVLFKQEDANSDVSDIEEPSYFNSANQDNNLSKNKDFINNTAGLRERLHNPESKNGLNISDKIFLGRGKDKTARVYEDYFTALGQVIIHKLSNSINKNYKYYEINKLAKELMYGIGASDSDSIFKLAEAELAKSGLQGAQKPDLEATQELFEKLLMINVGKDNNSFSFVTELFNRENPRKTEAKLYVIADFLIRDDNGEIKLLKAAEPDGDDMSKEGDVAAESQNSDGLVKGHLVDVPQRNVLIPPQLQKKKLDDELNDLTKKIQKSREVFELTNAALKQNKEALNKCKDPILQVQATVAIEADNSRLLAIGNPRMLAIENEVIQSLIQEKAILLVTNKSKGSPVEQDARKVKIRDLEKDIQDRKLKVDKLQKDIEATPSDLKAFIEEIQSLIKDKAILVADQYNGSSEQQTETKSEIDVLENDIQTRISEKENPIKEHLETQNKAVELLKQDQVRLQELIKQNTKEILALQVSIKADEEEKGNKTQKLISLTKQQISKDRNSKSKIEEEIIIIEQDLQSFKQPPISKVGSKDINDDELMVGDKVIADAEATMLENKQASEQLDQVPISKVASEDINDDELMAEWDKVIAASDAAMSENKQASEQLDQLPISSVGSEGSSPITHVASESLLTPDEVDAMAAEIEGLVAINEIEKDLEELKIN